MTTTERCELLWNDDDTEVRVGEVTYVCVPLPRPFPSMPDRFQLVKTRPQVERLVGLLDTLRPGRILELGTLQGGSAAFMAQLARPVALATIEHRDQRQTALAEFAERRGLADAIHIFSGVDQSDRRRLLDICTTVFAHESIDLVIDDASHRMPQSRVSFNALFPALREGGVYVIEDWSWAHTEFPPTFEPPPGFAVDVADHIPLSTLVIEALLIAARDPGVIAHVEATRGWCSITRGDAHLDPDGFDMADHLGALGLEVMGRVAIPLGGHATIGRG